MSTLARRHFQRASAVSASGGAEAGAPLDANAYELQLAQLHEDRRRLKQVQSLERKIAAKRQMLPQYMPWIEGALEGGKGGQDDVLMTMMVWAIDCGDTALALRIGAYALQHSLVMPDQFDRDVATILTEEIATLVLAGVPAAGRVEAGELQLLGQLVEGHDMPDEVRAKLHKAQALSMLDGIELDQVDPDAGHAALAHLKRALQLHDKAGVKKDIERLERALKNKPPSKNAADPAPPAAESTSSTPAGGQDPAT